MTRTQWRLRDLSLWLRKNREFIADLMFALLLSLALTSLGKCSLKRQEASFEAITLQAVHMPCPDGSTLVTFMQGGAIQGQTFADRASALAFAEALR